MSALSIVVAILGLGLLMVIHESGHFLAARYFGLRVTKFSIGFGPAIFEKQPKGSDTTYRIAIIPFLAYVQIAGMNPFEDIDPNDKGSYANAPVLARIVTIFGGPLANYLAASVLFFIALSIGGEEKTTTLVEVMPNSPAAHATLENGDKIVELDNHAITEWSEIRGVITKRPGQQTPITIERKGTLIRLQITPDTSPQTGEGFIGVKSVLEKAPVTLSYAAWQSVKRPPMVVYRVVADLGQIIARKLKPDVMGPVGMVNMMANVAKTSATDYIAFLGILSAYVAGFNLLPVPALDGGRLFFLAYEATTRKRANARVEAHIHAVGLLLLLALVAIITVFSDIPRFGN